MTVSPFPSPPPRVLCALELLEGFRKRKSGTGGRPGDLAEMKRPWEPAACDDDLREAVWGWCHDVVAWINHEYAWRPVQMIPACWPQHPHIARELPVVAVLRWQAEKAPDPEPMEEWNRLTLPMFTDRMLDRLGESSCRTGRHQDWPAESRFAAFPTAPS